MSTEQNNQRPTFTVMNPFKIINGSKMQLGNNTKIDVLTDQHFNWFQKLMWKLCFGVIVEDYNEE